MGVSISIRVSPCQIQWWPFSLKKKGLRQDTYQQQGLSNPGVVIFAEKKRLRQDTYQQQDLSNPGVVIFTKKKAPAARYLSATGFVKSRFSGPCQVGSVSCRVKSGP